MALWNRSAARARQVPSSRSTTPKQGWEALPKRGSCSAVQALDLEVLRESASAQAREWFEARWNRFRTLADIVTVASLLIVQALQRWRHTVCRGGYPAPRSVSIGPKCSKWSPSAAFNIQLATSAREMLA